MCQSHLESSTRKTSRIWNGFVSLRDATLTTPDDLFFISDRQKVLIQALHTTFRTVPHPFCLRPLAGNVRTRYRSRQHVVPLLYKSARSFDVETVREATESIKSVDFNAFTYLVDSDPTFCANSQFAGRRWGMVTQNTADSCNAWIGHDDDRSLPAMQLVQKVCLRIATLMYTRYEKARDYGDIDTVFTLSPNPRLGLEENSNSRRRINVHRTSESSFLVHSTQQYNVDIDKQQCSCGHWEEIGIPCGHGAAAISFAKKDYSLYFSPIYTKDLYHKVYSLSVTVPALPKLTNFFGRSRYTSMHAAPSRSSEEAT